MLVVSPWVGSRLELSVGVTERFARSVRENFGLEIGPVDHELKGRSEGSELGMLFSGGVDSVEGLSVLPASSPLIHLRRVRHRRIPNRATHLRTDVNVDSLDSDCLDSSEALATMPKGWAQAQISMCEYRRPRG